jgi:hypothetical protein
VGQVRVEQRRQDRAAAQDRQRLAADGQDHAEADRPVGLVAGDPQRVPR